jgi:hypothetical protein
MRSTLRNALVAALALGALASASASSALAQSTTMYPAKATLTASSAPVTINIPPWGNTTCTFNPGKWVVPNSGNPSGPLGIGYTTAPSYTECTPLLGSAVTVTTSGWTMAAQYGAASASVTIPVGGLTISMFGKAIEIVPNTEEPLPVLVGGWNNGFTSPVNVGTAVSYSGKLRLWSTEKSKWVESTFSPELSSVSSSSTMALLGP